MTDQVRPPGSGLGPDADDRVDDVGHGEGDMGLDDGDDSYAASDGPPAGPPDEPAVKDELSPEPQFEEGLIDDVSHLIDDGISYAQAEIAFQKTRASLAAKSAGFAAGYLVVSLFLLHIALLALAVGLIMALAPLVTIWGAIAIVVGLLLLVTAWLALKAKGRAQRASALFSNDAERTGG
ncbi:MAG: phage holin family protein [Erythrobacter sp.]